MECADPTLSKDSILNKKSPNCNLGFLNVSFDYLFMILIDHTNVCSPIDLYVLSIIIILLFCQLLCQLF